MAKFWGLVMDGGRRYMQKVEAGFCISMAALDTTSKETSPDKIKLYVERDKVQFLLCVLTTRYTPQLPLRVKFGKGETVALYFQGGSSSEKLHLSGYSFSDESAVIAFPFKGQQQSILVTEPKSADKFTEKNKKRVSIKENPEASREASSSDDDDDDEDEDIMAFSNGLDSDDEDDIQVVGSRAAAVKKIITDEADTDESDNSDDDDEDDDDDDDDDDLSDDEEEKEPLKMTLQTPVQHKQITKLQGHQQLLTPKQFDKRKSEPADLMRTPENQNIKLQKPSSAGHTPMKMFSKGGVMCEDLKVGNGPPAKQGRMVAVYYVGKLKNNNKKFDATESGPGFKFKLGKGEVIKGWDLGVEGMKVGGKRRLVIPPNLAYGKRGAPPDIPPNSTLVFEVDLKNIS